jgi:4-alpha-glucanotransferase
MPLLASALFSGLILESCGGIVWRMIHSFASKYTTKLPCCAVFGILGFSTGFSPCLSPGYPVSLRRYILARGRRGPAMPAISTGHRPGHSVRDQMKQLKRGKKDSCILEIGRKAGVGLHISSLPGRHGIGDIADSALSFIDTLTAMNIRVWQFLPTGPTAYGDSPYQPLSAFAGNTMLLGLDPLLRRGLLTKAEVNSLDDLPNGYTDYGRLIPAKRSLLARAAERFRAQRGHGLKTGYEEYLHLHGERWLNDYALFRILKTLHAERAWPEWGKPFVQRASRDLRLVADEHIDALERIRITQFLFERQWRKLRKYAAKNGVILFGDMPIYIALDSADAWAHPEMLLIDEDGRPTQVAGVPPDYFSADGQLWGNPLYDWEYHQRSGYRWWIARMEHAAGHADLVRIDHFRGFESCWSVPFGEKTARNGKWSPGPGDALFEAVRQSLGNLPIVAENLGVITEQVDALRLHHGIPGMIVLQFLVGDPDFDPGDIEENCVCYTGTHDNDTTQGWFAGKGDDTRTGKEIAQARARALALTGGSQETVHSDMIRLAFSSDAAIAVAPMQDYLGLGSEARLNTPGTTRNNWRWRLRSGQLQPDFLSSVAEMVNTASRA